MIFNLNELLKIGLFYTAFSFFIAVLFVVIKQYFYRDKIFLGKADIVIFNILTLTAVMLYTKSYSEVLLIFLICSPFYLGAYLKLKNFYVSGKLLLTSNLLFMIFSLLWGINFIYTIESSLVTKVLLYSGYPVLLISLFSGLVSTLEKWEIFCRKNWFHPKDTIINRDTEYNPRVSIQVPCYSEPPEIVIATLISISKLDYENYEVLVIDNNTKDPALWEPVRACCEKLGEKFKFYHVENLKGAKAGALNYVMQYMADDAEVIAVIDSDYQCEPDFISSLIGHFKDPKMGFVQTPHDYRNWEDSLYQRMCYWEYKTFFATVMQSLNEKDTALTVGTMCLIRRKAIEEAGGWAEWCNTEDSELSIRIHALGYSSVFVNRTFGRGLIPDTFSGYKKQRFRWTFGPVQELKKHFRLYLPKKFARPSLLTLKQKVHHLNHGLGYMNIAVSFLLTPISLFVLGSMAYHGEVVGVPGILIISSALYFTGTVALNFLIYLKLMNCSLPDTIGSMFAGRSLNHTYVAASSLCLVKDEIPWHRTNKFKSLPLGLNAMECVKTEFLLGVFFLSFSVAALAAIPAKGLHIFISAVLIIKSFDYFAAPIMAVLAEYDVRTREVKTASSKRPVQKGLGAVTKTG